MSLIIDTLEATQERITYCALEPFEGAHVTLLHTAVNCRLTVR